MTSSESIAPRGRGFLTMAGAPRYVRMAVSLAKSLRHHGTTTPISLVTNSDDPRLAGHFDQLIPLDPDRGAGVVQKLHLEAYSPYEKTIYIDSDCLCFGDADALWSIYEGAGADAFGVFGWEHLSADGRHYGVRDMGRCLAALGAERLPYFNTGVFYFDRSSKAFSVFESARNVLVRADELSIRSYREAPVTDEPVFAIAMVENGVEMLPEKNGEVMTLASLPTEGLEGIDVIRGRSRHGYVGNEVAPLIVHFNARTQGSWIHEREMTRLRLGPLLGRSPLVGPLARSRQLFGRLLGSVRRRLAS